MSVRVYEYSIPKRVEGGKDFIQAGVLLVNMAFSRLQNPLDSTIEPSESGPLICQMSCLTLFSH